MNTNNMAVLRVGTRGSALAMAQSQRVADALAAAAGIRAELVTIRTAGDIHRGPLAVIGGTGVFVTGVRDALRRGEVDVVVHSYKDLPTAPADGVRLAAVPAREDPADVLCAAHGRTLQQLPAGARVGTGSPRRTAQLLRLRPDLVVLPVRGNVDTRLRMVTSGEVDAVVLAKAGLARLRRLDAVTQEFAGREMLPAPAQGALAVECADHGAARSGLPADAALPADLAAVLADALSALDDPPSRAATEAERALLAGLEAGCTAPVGALATVANGRIVLAARVVSVDGSDAREHTCSGPVDRAADVGRRAAQALLAAGAAELMGRPAP